jgi:hypothetical protein
MSGNIVEKGVEHEGESFRWRNPYTLTAKVVVASMRTALYRLKLVRNMKVNVKTDRFSELTYKFSLFPRKKIVFIA